MKPGSFEDHIVFEKLEQLKARLVEEETKVELETERYEFYESVHKYISDRLKLTIPLLVQEAELNNISNEIEAGLSQINSYLGSNNEGYLNNANNNFYSALNRIRNLPLPFAKNDFNFSKSVASFQNKVKSGYEKLRASSEQLQSELSSYEEDLKLKKEELVKLDKLIEEKKTEIENLTESYSSQYETIKSNAEATQESDREIFRQEIDLDKQTFRKEIDELKETIDSDTTEVVTNLEQKLEEAKKIVNVIGNVGVTGNYQIIANQHKKSADFWRVLAILFMALLSGIMIYTIWDISGSNFDWTKSLIRIIAAAALSYPATYAARESSKHRKLETVNRTAELELASINPFIENLDDSKKQEIKEKLVERYFGNSGNSGANSDPKDEELSVGGFEKLIKAFLPFIKK